MTLWDLANEIGKELEYLYSMDVNDDRYIEQFNKYRRLKAIFLRYRTKKLTKAEQQSIIITENIEVREGTK